ncbi:hypothetical protein [Novosphingobium sp. ST904]|nr:hypothetical protein [Novosphingobium sp. ST904]
MKKRGIGVARLGEARAGASMSCIRQDGREIRHRLFSFRAAARPA